MSKEIDDIEVELATDLQPLAPKADNGPPIGEAQAHPAPEAINLPPVAHRAPVGLAGEPGTLPLTYCRKCASDGVPNPYVMPIGKGRCPRDNTFVRQNFARRRHPQNVLRKDQILADLVAEYSPANVIERHTCEHLAVTLEQLETMRPGTTEWQRIMGVKQELSVTLGDAQKSRTHTPRALDAMSAMSDSTLTLLRSLTTRIAEGETLGPFEEGQLFILRGGMYGDLLLPADPDPAVVDVPPSATYTPTTDTMMLDVAPVEEIAPPATCKFCYQSLAECAVMRDQRPDVFASLHRLDPVEVKKRDDYATAEMLHMIGRKR